MQSDSQGWAKSRLDSFIASNAELKSAGQAAFKPKKNEEKKEKKQPPKLSKYKQWLKDFDPNGPIPFVAPGRILRLNTVVAPKSKVKNRQGFFEEETGPTKSLNDIALSVKGILGPDIGDLPNGASILARVARAMGNLWVDEQNKLRCPAGTPAANQFTNLQMTNCMVPSARTVASDVLDIAAGPSKNQAQALLSGRMAAIDPNDRLDENVGYQGGKVWRIGSKEKARRVSAWLKRQRTKQAALMARHGVLQTPKQLKNAILETFPNVNRKSLDALFADRPDLTPEEYMKWLAYREGILKSMLYEAMMNPTLAESQLFFKIDDISGALMQADVIYLDKDVATLPGSGTPFGLGISLTFNPKNIADGIDTQDPDWRAVPFGSGKDGTFTPLEAGLYDGTHETLGHLGHFLNGLERLGIDTQDMNIEAAVNRIKAKAVRTDEEQALLDFWDNYENDLKSMSPGEAYEKLVQEIETQIVYNIGVWNEDVLESMRKMLGTLYGQANDKKGWLHNETRAEMAVLLRDMPELVQEWIDQENIDRATKGLPQLPNVDQLVRDGYGKDVVPNTAITADSEEARPTNVGASIRRFFGSLRGRDGEDFDPRNPDDIDNLVNAVETLEQNRIDKIEKEIKDEALDILFRYYTPEEAQRYFDTLEQYGARLDSELALRLLPVPEIFVAHRSPSGMKTSEEVEWEAARMTGLGGTDWLDTDEIEARRILYGNEGFVRTARRAAGRAGEKVQERVREIQKSRDAKKQLRQLSGKMSKDRKRLRFSEGVEEMIDDAARPKIRTTPSGKGKRVVQRGNTVDPSWMKRLDDDQLLDEIDAMENAIEEQNLLQQLSPQGQLARRQMLEELNKERIRRKLRRRWRRTERDQEERNRDRDRDRGRDRDVPQTRPPQPGTEPEELPTYPFLRLPTPTEQLDKSKEEALQNRPDGVSDKDWRAYGDYVRSLRPQSTGYGTGRIDVPPVMSYEEWSALNERLQQSAQMSMPAGQATDWSDGQLIDVINGLGNAIEADPSIRISETQEEYLRQMVGESIRRSKLSGQMFGRRRRNSARAIIEDVGGEPDDPITAEIKKRNSENSPTEPLVGEDAIINKVTDGMGVGSPGKTQGTLLDEKNRTSKLRPVQEVKPATRNLKDGDFVETPVDSKTISFGDSGKVEMIVDVWQIGGEKVAFGAPTRERENSGLGLSLLNHDNDGNRWGEIIDLDFGFEDDVVQVPLNPYVIAGLDYDSQEGFDTALDFVYAVTEATEAYREAERAEFPEGRREGDNMMTWVAALLYAGSRGDGRAMAEFRRLATEGRRKTEELAEGVKKRDLERRPIPERRERAARDNPGMENLTLDDVLLVHEVIFDPEYDEEGNILMRPNGDWVQAATDEEMEYVSGRQTIHFSLNHPVTGHMQRPGFDGKRRFLIVSNAGPAIKRNQGSLDNFASVDTWFTPRPNEPLVLPKETTRVIEIPEGATAYDVERLFRDGIKGMGKDPTRPETDDQIPLIVEGGEHGSRTAGFDSMVSYLAGQMDVTDTAHFEHGHMWSEQAHSAMNNTPQTLFRYNYLHLGSDNNRVRRVAHGHYSGHNSSDGDYRRSPTNFPKIQQSSDQVPSPEGGRLSGRMSSPSPAQIESRNIEVLDEINNAGGNLLVDEAYARANGVESRANRLARQRESIRGQVQELKELVNGELPDDISPDVAEYIRTTPEEQILQDIEQTALDFHNGLDKSVKVNIPSSRIMDFLNDGRYKTTHETGSDHSDSSIRSEFESSIGIPSTAIPEVRPASGYLVHKDWIAANRKRAESRLAPGGKVENIVSTNPELMGNPFIYGDMELVLKPEVSGRTSYGYGDSLRNSSMPSRMTAEDPEEILTAILGQTGQQRRSRALDLIDARVNGTFEGGAWDTYVEALVMGSFGVGDVDTIVAHRVPVAPKYAGNDGFGTLLRESVDIDSLVADGATPEEAREIMKLVDETISSGRIMGANGMIEDGVLGRSWIPQTMSMANATELKDQLDSRGIKLVVEPSAVGSSRYGVDVMDMASYPQEDRDRHLTPVDVARSRLRKQMINDLRSRKSKSPSGQQRRLSGKMSVVDAKFTDGKAVDIAEIENVQTQYRITEDTVSNVQLFPGESFDNDSGFGAIMLGYINTDIEIFENVNPQGLIDFGDDEPPQTVFDHLNNLKKMRDAYQGRMRQRKVERTIDISDRDDINYPDRIEEGAVEYVKNLEDRDVSETVFGIIISNLDQNIKLFEQFNATDLMPFSDDGPVQTVAEHIENLRALRNAHATRLDEKIKQSRVPEPKLEVSEQSQALPKEIAEKAAKRVEEATKKRQKILVSYLNRRYGEGNAPWKEMTAQRRAELSKIINNPSSTDAQKAQAQKELEQWVREMYSHELIEGSNGRRYAITVDTINYTPNQSGTDFISAEMSIIEIDENGKQIGDRVGYSKRTLYNIGDEYISTIYNDNFFILSDEHKKSGIQTVYNGHAFMYARAAGIRAAKLRAAADGPYVWGRVGYRNDKPIMDVSIKAMEDEITKFRDGLKSIVENAEDAEILEFLIEKWRINKNDVAHIDFIMALSVVGDKETQDARRKALNDWFIFNMPIVYGVLDFEENMIAVDPREIK